MLFLQKNITVMKKVIYPKISFCATTIGWSYGSTFGLGITVADGCSCYISWGDGRQTSVVGNGKRMEFVYDYFPKVIIPDAGITFYVEIVSYEENCRITEFGVSCSEMVISKLDLQHCLELKSLWCPMMYEPFTLDLSKLTALRYLDCNGSGDNLVKLDVSNNIELVELYCRSNRIKTLDLSNNTALRVLDCEYNDMDVLRIYYGSQLKDASFTEGNNIDAYTQNEIMEIINSNPPVEKRELTPQVFMAMPLYK
jgi:hypothetical protein